MYVIQSQEFCKVGISNNVARNRHRSDRVDVKRKLAGKYTKAEIEEVGQVALEMWISLALVSRLLYGWPLPMPRAT